MKVSKYRLVKDKVTQEKAIVIYLSGEVVTERVQPERYAELRKKAINNASNRAKNEVLRDLCGTSSRQARIDMGI